MEKTLGIVDFSVRKRVTITMFILIVMVFGLLSLSRLGLDMLPDITFPMVTVVTQYSGVAPEEIEELITKPLEGMIAAVNGVKKISSQSTEGVSAITVEFEWGTNLDYAAQDIKDNIDFVRDFLPDDMTEPVVFKFNLSQIPIMFVGVSGMENTYHLRRTLQDNVTERLQRLDGVAQAAVFGGEQREIRVAFNPAKLALRNLSIDEVAGMLAGQNLNLPAGYHVERGTDFLIRSVGEFESIEDMRSAIIGFSSDGTAIRLREVATVKDTYKERRSISLMNGAESVFLVINKRSGANTLQVSNRIAKEMKKINELFPKLEFTTIFDQGRPVERITMATSMNAVVGGVLAIFFMFFFLLNIRPTLAIAVAMPLSIITTFIAIYTAGFTLNLMTLGGLALGVGMLVDNAIVVIENIYRHLEHGQERAIAARVGASEVATAITASTFTTIVVFLPLLFSEGITAQLTRGMSLTIVFALLSSLFVALTIVPMLASVFFKSRRQQETSKWFVPVREGYGRTLAWVLHNPGKTALGVGLFLVVSLVAARGVGTEFMPEGDQNMFLLQIDLPVGTPLEESATISAQVRDLLLEYPEIAHVGESIGRDENDRGGDQAAVTGPHTIQMFVRTLYSEERERTVRQVQDDIRSRLPKLSDTRFTFQNMGMMGQSEKAVKVNVYGRDLETLEEIAGNVEAVLMSVPGLRDIESSFAEGRPEYRFHVDRQKALMYGLAPAQIQKSLEAANLGRIVTRYRTGEDEIDVRLILDKKYRDDLDWIRGIELKTPVGSRVPLGQVVTIRKAVGPTVINRDNKFRVGTVDASLAEGAVLGQAVGELKQKLARIEQALPDGYSIEFKGQFEDMQESFSDLLLGLVLAILLVYMVMASQFESLMHPLIILLTFPLAVIGVIWILLLAGKTFSVVTFVGVIILAGIAVNNGIVMVDYVNQLRRSGMATLDALVEGGKTRIRPVIITAGTTICGMLPMALSRSEGSEMRSPMALTVIGGLLSATFLTLFVIPIMYLVLDKLGEKIKGGFKKILH